MMLAYKHNIKASICLAVSDKKIYFYLFFTCDPLKHELDNPIFIIATSMENQSSQNQGKISLQTRQPHLQDLSPIQDSYIFNLNLVVQ